MVSHYKQEYMSKNRYLLFGASLVLMMLQVCTSYGQLTLTVESGLVFNTYNDVRVPNAPDNQGSLFSLTDDFTPQLPGPFLRVEAAYLIKDRHTVELQAVPAAVNYENFTGDSVSFAGTTFRGEGITGRYEFNTYRASYRYRVVNRERFQLDIGATALIRDARIAVAQGENEAEDVDLGFVPLLSLQLQYAATDKLSLLLKGDAIAGSEFGRAEDVFAGITYALYQDSLRLKAGYRIVEGGANVDQVYNFALLQFADIGLAYTF
ncbi:MAG TPA: hypothetical protein DCR93_34640 [Cytophagales bacterium]|nr:hypothetical protein [Cytophagales bacterium]